MDDFFGNSKFYVAIFFFLPLGPIDSVFFKRFLMIGMARVGERFEFSVVRLHVIWSTKCFVQ